MDTNELPAVSQDRSQTSATRREFIKVAGLAALGMVYTTPMIETIRPKSSLTTTYGFSPPDDD